MIRKQHTSSRSFVQIENADVYTVYSDDNNYSTKSLQDSNVISK